MQDLNPPDPPADASFRELIEKAEDGVLVLRDGAIAYANPEAGRLLGRPVGELIGAAFGRPVVPGDTVEIDVSTPDPEADDETAAPRVAEMRVVAASWEGRPASLATLRDVTRRKQDGEALRFLSDASNLLAGSLDPVTTLDNVARLAAAHLADWCLIDLVEGDAAARSLRRVAAGHADPARGAQVRSLCGLYPFESPTNPGVGRVVATGWMEVFARVGDEELGSLALQPRHVGTFRDLGCRSALVAPMVARGRPLGAITYCSATPHRFSVRNEQTLAQDLADRAALAVDNARLYDASQEAVRRRDEFLAMLAHELRNPLAPILHATELLKLLGDRADDRERQRATIERQGRHLARLLDDLLDLSRVTHGKIDLRQAPVDLSVVVRDALQLSQHGIDSRGHHLTVEPPPRPLLVHGDPTRLAQVLGNLLSNAARYTPPGGRIELRTFGEQGEAVLRVSDNGRGIPPDMLNRVFEPFLQLDTTAERSEGGLGIGLTLVRRLVELHRGQVIATSPGVGRGSTFEVRLPLTSAAPTGPAPAPPRQLGARRVLLVEDNPDGRDMLGELLRAWGHEAEAAGDGVRGLERMRQTMPDVALIDIGLPGMDGYEVARAVRALPGGDGVFLIALTGYGQPDDRARALAAGFDEHLVKPVDLTLLPRLIARGRG